MDENKPIIEELAEVIDDEDFIEYCEESDNWQFIQELLSGVSQLLLAYNSKRNR